MEEIIKKLDKKLKVLKYENIDDNLVEIYVERTNKSAYCPCCGKKAVNIHSKYIRTIKDLPIQEDKVILKIITNQVYLLVFKMFIHQAYFLLQYYLYLL